MFFFQEMYTYVLQGVINLASAKFPRGTYGMNLAVLNLNLPIQIQSFH